MTQIILSGALGRMGREIAQLCQQSGSYEIVAGVDKNASTGVAEFPLYKEISEVTQKADCIIDFSNPNQLESLLAYAKDSGLPLVICTTGYSDDQLEQINNAAKDTSIFFSYNMSLGINLLAELSRKAAAVLGEDFDIEIVESHHNQKIDAPSGTAILLANEINDACDNRYTYEYNRQAKREKRSKNEIGIHAVRGGTIVGEHKVIFAGNNEVIELSHGAYSRSVFATGALRAAQYIAGRPAGLYSMKNLLSEI